MSAGSTALSHQFEDAEQQREAVTLGLWTFLLTEVMLFGGLFAGYTAYRAAYPEAFVLGSRQLDVMLGGVNTAVLICSSLTMALAVRSAQLGKRQALIVFLVLTMLFGSAFLGIKGVEYAHKFHEHLIPGPDFRFASPHAGQVQLFFSFYFALTATHGVHMIVGLGLLGVLVYQAKKGRFTPAYNSPVDLSGLYWHFVDIVWIFLYPLLYLLGRH